MVKWKWRFFCVHKIMQNVKIHAVQLPSLLNILSSHCDLWVTQEKMLIKFLFWM